MGGFLWRASKLIPAALLGAMIETLRSWADPHLPFSGAGWLIATGLLFWISFERKTK